jgi:GDP-L-fucose synthase
MKKVLICGASGFIGRNLFETLSQRPDLDVYGTYNTKRFSKSRKLYKVDLTDKESAMTVARNMDVVINASAVTDGSGAIKSNPNRYIADNIRINTNIIESAADNKVNHFIFLSCSIIYPACSNGLTGENDVNISMVHPAYWMSARIKIFCEDMCRNFANVSNCRFTIIRHSNNYGPFDKFDTKKGHFFSATVEKIMNPKDKHVIVWGDGLEVRDLLHVYDLVGFIEQAIRSNTKYQCDVFNVGSGDLLSIKSLVEKINKLSGKNLPIYYDTSKLSIDTKIALDTVRAKYFFNWQPTIDIDSGIRHTIDWYIKNKRIINAK